MSSSGFGSLAELADELIECRRCPRLVEWREQVATEKRASFADDVYWGRPVPGFGDASAELVIVGLAPAAHGANRTGRMFTGDRSGEWLYRALHAAGFANQAEATGCNDGLRLTNAWVTSAVRCAPPANKPVPKERDSCASWLRDELNLLSDARVYLCLGQYGYHSLWRYLGSVGADLPKPRPKFGHGAEIVLDDGRRVLLSYHPSQQNTFTGKLTREMFDEVFGRARSITRSRGQDPGP